MHTTVYNTALSSETISRKYWEESFQRKISHDSVITQPLSNETTQWIPNHQAFSAESMLINKNQLLGAEV
jgi:hypothetical protein